MPVFLGPSSSDWKVHNVIKRWWSYSFTTSAPTPPKKRKRKFISLASIIQKFSVFRSVLHKCCFFCLLPFTFHPLSFVFPLCLLPFTFSPLSFVLCRSRLSFALYLYPLYFCLSSSSFTFYPLSCVFLLSPLSFAFTFYPLSFLFLLSLLPFTLYPLFFVFCLSPSSFTFYPLSFVVLLSPLSFAFYPLSFVFCLSPLSFASLFKEKRNASLSHTNESSLLQDTSFALKAPEIAKWKELFRWEHALAIAEPSKHAWQSNSKILGLVWVIEILQLN